MKKKNESKEELLTQYISKKEKMEKLIEEGSKIPKSMRTLFGRISSINETKDGIVTYSFDDICRILSEWNETKEDMSYYAIEHSSDDGSNKHYHVVIEFDNPTSFEQIKKKFPYGQIASARSIKYCLAYLVHKNNPEKKQYEWSQIVTNDVERLIKFRTLIEKEQTLNRILAMIDSGDINEYNQYDKINILFYADYETKIKRALRHYMGKLIRNPNRNISIYVLQGESNTYKTTFAKEYAKKLGKNYYISSASNDPMQDYKGQKVLILDDLRDYVFGIDDLIKVIDPFNSSTTKSRFNNKLFIGDTIFITTNVDIRNWFPDIDKETKIALYRRITKIYDFKRTSNPNVSEYFPIEFDINRKSFLEYRDDKKEFDISDYISEEEMQETENKRKLEDPDLVFSGEDISYSNPTIVPVNESINNYYVNDGYQYSESYISESNTKKEGYLGDITDLF